MCYASACVCMHVGVCVCLCLFLCVVGQYSSKVEAVKSYSWYIFEPRDRVIVCLLNLSSVSL